MTGCIRASLIVVYISESSVYNSSKKLDANFHVTQPTVSTRPLCVVRPHSAWLDLWFCQHFGETQYADGSRLVFARKNTRIGSWWILKIKKSHLIADVITRPVSCPMRFRFDKLIVKNRLVILAIIEPDPFWPIVRNARFCWDSGPGETRDCFVPLKKLRQGFTVHIGHLAWFGHVRRGKVSNTARESHSRKAEWQIVLLKNKYCRLKK